MKEIQQLKKKVEIFRELGDDWRKNVAILNEAFRDGGEVLESIKRLSKKSDQSNLVKIGLTLIAFPLPIVVDDILGWSLLTAGLIQRKIRNSSLHLEDVYDSLSDIIKELQATRQEMF